MKKASLLLSASLIISGCTAVAPHPELQHHVIEGNTVLSSTASLSHTMVRKPNDPHIICSQTAPDATFDQESGFNFSIALVNTGGSESLGEEEGSEEVEMTGRTPALLITRELFYRTCEFAVNYNLSKQEAKALFNKTMDAVTEAWMAETENTTVTIGDNLEVKATTTITDDRSASNDIDSEDEE